MIDSSLIKVVATDIDGTFLTSLDNGRTFDHQLFQKVFTELQKRQMHFVFASGEPYDSLRELLPQFADQIAYVADNGGRVVDCGTEIFHGQFANQTVHEIAHFLDQLPGVVYSICGLDSDFVANSQPAFYRKRISHFYPNLTTINSLDELHGPIFKFAMDCPKELSQQYCQQIEAHFAGRVQATSSGLGSIDLIIPGLDKASGLRKLLQHWGQKEKQLIAFGDGENDITMLQLAKYSYAMKNAPAQIQKVAKYLAPSNDDQGVLHVLAKLFATNKENYHD